MPSWSDVRRFVEHDGWELRKHGTRHDLYRKILIDGTILETRISHEAGEIHGLWPHILNLQLQCSQAYFNTVKNGGRWNGPGRGL